MKRYLIVKCYQMALIHLTLYNSSYIWFKIFAFNWNIFKKTEKRIEKITWKKLKKNLEKMKRTKKDKFDNFSRKMKMMRMCVWKITLSVTSKIQIMLTNCKCYFPHHYRKRVVVWPNPMTMMPPTKSLSKYRLWN